MGWVVVSQKVQDYAKWKAGFDGHAPARKAAGAGKGYVLRSIDDPNQIVVALEVEDLAQAREFTQSEDLREAMKRAGVIGPPTVWLLDAVEEVGG